MLHTTTPQPPPSFFKKESFTLLVSREKGKDWPSPLHLSTERPTQLELTGHQIETVALQLLSGATVNPIRD